MDFREFYSHLQTSKKTQSIFLASILLVSFSSLELFSIIDADHNTITESLGSGPQTISLRDITNPNSVSSINGVVGSGILYLTVLDPDADLDTTKLDIIHVNANSTASGPLMAMSTLYETDVNTAEFTGEITLSSNTTTGSTLQVNGRDTIQYFYESHPLDTLPSKELVSEGSPLGLARLTANVNLATPGDVTITDSIITDDEIVNFCFRPITHAAEISLENGATQTPSTDMQIIFSYANGVLLPGDDPSLLKMYYKEPLLGWKIIRENYNVMGFNPTDKTITSVPSQAGFIPGLFDGVTQGQFVLAFETGCGGGGGGGLVRPSLVVNALAGLGSFGGGADPSPPTIDLGNLIQSSNFDLPQEVEQMVLNHDSTVPIAPHTLGAFGDFDFPLAINENGFILGGFSNTIETQTIKTNSPTSITFTIYEATKIQHISFYTNLRDANTQIHQSDTQILYNDGQPLEIVDPNGFFQEVSLAINEEEDSNKKQVVLDVVFQEPMDKSDLIVRSWDPYLNSRDTFVLDAIEVVSKKTEKISEPTYEAPVFVELEHTGIPIWIKNNAAWWSQAQIGDGDFVSGIEYLIKSKIIHVPGVEVGASPSSDEIPDWIKNNAGWWADSLITDGDFIEAMQWLVANGVIQI